MKPEPPSRAAAPDARAQPLCRSSTSLPLARIKRIMRQDCDVHMISSEAPVLFARACELFVQLLVASAWSRVDRGRRRTLLGADIVRAVQETDTFDFLRDVLVAGSNEGAPPAGEEGEDEGEGRGDEGEDEGDDDAGEGEGEGRAGADVGAENANGAGNGNGAGDGIASAAKRARLEGGGGEGAGGDGGLSAAPELGGVGSHGAAPELDVVGSHGAAPELGGVGSHGAVDPRVLSAPGDSASLGTACELYGAPAHLRPTGAGGASAGPPSALAVSDHAVAGGFHALPERGHGSVHGHAHPHQQQPPHRPQDAHPHASHPPAAPYGAYAYVPPNGADTWSEMAGNAWPDLAGTPGVWVDAGAAAAPRPREGEDARVAREAEPRAERHKLL